MTITAQATPAGDLGTETGPFWGDGGGKTRWGGVRDVVAAMPPLFPSDGVQDRSH